MRRVLSVVLCSVLALASAEAMAKKKKKRKKKGGADSGEMAGGGAGAKPYGMAGCGLGAVLMGPDGNQILAATTNQYSGQTYSITTGTSACVSAGTAAARADQERFIIANLSTLMKEMSQGDGETLTAFSGTLGCNETVYPKVAASLQEGYSDIFRAPGAMAVLNAAKTKLGQDPELMQSCAHLMI